MYKVFFNDRKLILTDSFSKHFMLRHGLFYKYRSEEDLKELIYLYQKLNRIDSLYVFHSDIDELRDSFRKCFIQLHAAGGLVRNNKDEFLLIFRRGKWDLPKGKLDKHESFEEAALREVSEECGIDKLRIEQPLISTYHTYEYKDALALKKTRWFEMKYEGTAMPVPQLEEDISEAKWVPADKLGPYLDKSYPAVRDVMIYYGV
jgi:8-oxo-dGTP pyrophosphatase MutT (NUDIX family)